MAVPKSFKEGFLVDDEEELFRQYYDGPWGTAATFEKLQQWWTKQHGVNPNTGKHFSNQAFHQACWRWGLRNLDEARELYAKHVMSFGFYLDDAIWKKTVQERARMCLKTASRTFFREHPEYAPEEEE